MNASLVKARELRRSPQGVGTLYPVPQPAKSVQHKPVFQVLENSATSDALIQKAEYEAFTKLKQRPITSRTSFESISYAFSFPLCDLLICEFPATQSVVGLSTSLVRESQETVAEKVSRVAHYIYQKVIRRKAIPFQPSPQNPKYMLCYVEEELECGHKLTVYPSAIETLTARKRSCHECSSWFGGLKLPPGKKPNASILRSYERIRNSKGFGNWYAVIFGTVCFGLMGLIAYSHQPRIYTFVAPADTFRVIAQDSDFNFILQQVHVGVPQKEAVYHFCPSQPMPRFQVGMTLDQLVYEEKGDCQQLAKGIAYIIERDETLPGHWPKLAPNCANLGVGKPVVCDGKPRWEEK